MNTWWGCRTPSTNLPSSICIPWHGQPVETVVCVKLHCDCSTPSCWRVLFCCSWKTRGEIWFSNQKEYSSTVSGKISNPPVSQWCKIWMKFEDAIVHFVIGLLYIQYILRVALSFISHHVVRQLCLKLDLQMFEIPPLLYVFFYITNVAYMRKIMTMHFLNLFSVDLHLIHLNLGISFSVR